MVSKAYSKWAGWLVSGIMVSAAVFLLVQKIKMALLPNPLVKIVLFFGLIGLAVTFAVIGLVILFNKLSSRQSGKSG